MDKKNIKNKIANINLSTFFSKKWLVILCVSIILIVFGRLVTITPLTESAIVIGIGLDITDSQKFKITAQTIVVGGSANQGSPINYVGITEEGNTVAQAFDRIGQRLGLKVSLAHCNIVVISEKALKVNHYQLFYPLTTYLAMPEQCAIMTCGQTPEEIVTMRVVPSVASPFYLQTALAQNTGSDGLMPVTIKDMLCSFKSKSNGLVLPYIVSQTLANPPINENDILKDYNKFVVNKVVAVSDTDYEVLDERMSRAAVMINAQKVLGTLNTNLDDGSSVEFNIINKENKLKAKGYTVEADIKFILSFYDAQYVNSDTILRGTSEISKEGAKNLEKNLVKDLKDCFELSKKINIDFLGIQDTVYRYLGMNMKPDSLNDCQFNPKVSIKIKENY